MQNRHHSLNDNNEPLAALQRDSFAVIDHSRDSSEMYLLVNQQLNSLENLVIQQRRSQARVARVLKEAETRHRKVRIYKYDYLSRIPIYVFFRRKWRWKYKIERDTKKSL